MLKLYACTVCVHLIIILRAQPCRWIDISAYVREYMYVCASAHVCACMCVCVCVYMHACNMCVHVWVARV